MHVGGEASSITEEWNVKYTFVSPKELIDYRLYMDGWLEGCMNDEWIDGWIDR